MPRVVQYYGTPNYQEFPLTGKLRLWTRLQKQNIDDADAARLVAAGVGFVYDNDDTGEVVTSVLDSSGNVTGLSVGGGRLPLVPEHTMAIFGDSISAQCTVNTGTQQQLTDYSYIGWAQILSNQAFNFSLANNFGVAGETSTQILARISSVIAAAPSYCVVLAGTNDIYSGISYATTISNLQAIYGQLVGAGVKVIAVPIIPRAKDNASGLLPLAQRYMIQRINNWIVNNAQTQVGVYLADPTRNIVDYTASGANLGDPVGGISAAKTAYTYDGLHPNPRAAWAIGKAIADVLAILLVPRYNTFENPADVYDATNNINGNVLTNGQMAGTAGTLSGTTTGTVSTSFTLNGLAGTVTGSNPALTLDNGLTIPQQVIALGASSTARLFRQLFAPASLTVGDRVVMECEVTVTSPVALQQLELHVNDATVNAFCMKNTANGYFPATNFTATYQTPPITLTSIAVVTCWLQAATDTGGSATIAVRKFSLKKL